MTTSSSTIKAALRPVKRTIKWIIGTVDSSAARLAAGSRPLSNLYYALQGNFGREHRAVLHGRRRYLESLRNPSGNTSLLRRNVHRLEKGLLMRPRRLPFGLDYIKETVLAYSRAAGAGAEINELLWARDVLEEYMSITPQHAIIDPLREVVSQTTASILHTADPHPRTPYLRSRAEQPTVSYEQLLKLAEYRRSVRWFMPDAVPRHLIDRAIEVAAYSPSACNRQPFEFRVFDDPDLVSKIIKLPMGTSGFGHQVPTLAVVIGKQRNYFSERDRHLIYIDGSLAIMSFVYALEVQGLGSCCINWPDIEDREQKMQKLLDLQPDERPIMLVALGYPDAEGMVANSTKKSLSIMRRYNFEEPSPPAPAQSERNPAQ